MPTGQSGYICWQPASGLAGKIASTAKAPHMSGTWYPMVRPLREEGGGAGAGLGTRPRTGRPPSVYGLMMRKMRKPPLKTTGWRAGGMRELIHGMTCHEIDPSYAEDGGGGMGEGPCAEGPPAAEHISRAAGGRMCRFQKSTHRTVRIKGTGMHRMQPGRIHNRGRGPPGRGAHTPSAPQEGRPYAGRHPKTIILELMSDDGMGCFECCKKFTTKESVKFLENPCKKFGRILVILDRPPPPPGTGQMPSRICLRG